MHWRWGVGGEGRELGEGLSREQPPGRWVGLGEVEASRVGLGWGAAGRKKKKKDGGGARQKETQAPPGGGAAGSAGLGGSPVWLGGGGRGGPSCRRSGSWAWSSARSKGSRWMNEGSRRGGDGERRGRVQARMERDAGDPRPGGRTRLAGGLRARPLRAPRS